MIKLLLALYLIGTLSVFGDECSLDLECSIGIGFCGEPIPMRKEKLTEFNKEMMYKRLAMMCDRVVPLSEVKMPKPFCIKGICGVKLIPYKKVLK